ncbi:uncharacterized protein LOC126745601 [Anthonomus grandis grandis]|uniref:uncharacterized protein LOC126745601 n=1 Tax=Anthonomus grandis grandis TaxID=2921223 RepID=UPI0021659BAD|nr:uncharacterized protein LOC126745601 [Anthonomus grandis grandis]
MNKITKSVEEVKSAISDHFLEANATASSQAKKIDTVTKNIKRDHEHLVDVVKKAPANNVKQVQKNYMEKGSEMFDFLAGATGSRRTSVDDDNNDTVDVNLRHLKDIVQTDLKNSKEESKQLVDTTKAKLNNFIGNLFKDHSSKGNFSTTAAVLFENFNKKLKDDLIEKSLNAQRTRSSLSPDLATIFYDPRVKSQEEIEAERLLQEYFEEEILAFSEQSKNSFQNTNEKIQKDISETMEKIKKTLVGIQEVANKETEKADSKSCRNLPSKSEVAQNLNDFLGKAEQDFQKVQKTMKNDVEDNKNKINENAKYYAEKFLGRHFGAREDDENYE